jgi:hypothetical protein
MTTIAIAASATGVFALAVCQFYNLKIMESQSKRIKALEKHFGVKR